MTKTEETTSVAGTSTPTTASSPSTNDRLNDLIRALDRIEASRRLARKRAS